MWVWAETQTWRNVDTMSCTEYPIGGDCIDYIRRRDRVTYLEALRILAKKVSIPSGWEEACQEQIAPWQLRREIEELLTWTALFNHDPTLYPDVVDHLTGWLGVDQHTIVTQFLGLSEEHLWHDIFEVFSGLSQEQALATGLFVPAGQGLKNFFIEDQAILPCWRGGRVVNMIGVRQGVKGYTTLSSNPHLSSHMREICFYGEDTIRRNRPLFVVEDPVDALVVIRHGFSAVATLGRLGPDQVSHLVRLSEGVKRLILHTETQPDIIGTLLSERRSVVLGQVKGLRSVVGEEGSAALDHIIQGARPALTHLVELIPASTTVDELGPELETVLSLYYELDPIQREGLERLLRDRFSLRADTVRSLLQDRGRDEAEPAPLRGEVLVERGCYCVRDTRGNTVAVSNFVIRPHRLLDLDEEEVIEGDVVREDGTTYPAQLFPHRAFSSPQAFRRILGRFDLSWTGSEAHIQGVARQLSSEGVPRIRGSRTLGYLETDLGPRWIAPGHVLAPEGVNPGEVVFVGSGQSTELRLDYREEDKCDAARILPRLLELNEPGAMLPILGWLFASPVRPRIQAELGAFPILCLWGTAGSGKTSLMVEVLLPLLGLAGAQPYSCSGTEASLIGLLSSTTSIPVFLDEYKPASMPRAKKEALHRLIREAYQGSARTRGRANRTVEDRTLQAPLCIAGESRPTETAVVERLISTTLSKLALTSERRGTFQELRRSRLSGLAAGLIRFLLGRDTKRDLGQARQITDEVLRGKDITPRIRTNLIVMNLGLIHLEQYAHELHAELPRLDHKVAVESVLEDILSEGVVKSGLDYFLEKLSRLALRGIIEMGKEYPVDGGELYVDLEPCLDEVNRTWRSSDEGERLDRRALRRLIRENQLDAGYVKETTSLETFRPHDRRRAVVIDLEKAREHLDLDGFRTR
jgi:hypothetical protein